MDNTKNASSSSSETMQSILDKQMKEMSLNMTKPKVLPKVNTGLSGTMSSTLPLYDTDIWLPINLPETLVWLTSKPLLEKPFTIELLRSWMVSRNRNNAIKSDLFCDAKLLDELDDTMKKLSALDPDRDQCALLKKQINPFEEIGKTIFNSRETIKAANVDSLIKFTNPVDEKQRPLSDSSHEEFGYTDFYGERHGFNEYIKWRMNSQQKRSRNVDVSALRDPKIVGRKADVTDPQTMDKFIRFVRRSGPVQGLHLVVIDFYSISFTDELSVEVKCRQAALCYCVLGLKLLRPNGTFIMKMFKSLTPFTVGLLYLMRRCFGQLTIVKPNACRPHGVERYLVCKWKVADSTATDNVCRYLMEVNEKFNELKSTDLDVVELVPRDMIQADEDFIKYIWDGNVLLTRQILLCWQRMALLQNTLHDPRAYSLRKMCLELWNVPEMQDSHRTNYTVRRLQQTFN